MGIVTRMQHWDFLSYSYCRDFRFYLDEQTSLDSVTATSTVAKEQLSKQAEPYENYNKVESKPVECNLCHRKFKNVPALNGHMRLHGGYYKKGQVTKKCKQKEKKNSPSLSSVSTNDYFLLNEKIKKTSIALSGSLPNIKFSSENGYLDANSNQKDDINDINNPSEEIHHTGHNFESISQTNGSTRTEYTNNLSQIQIPNFEKINSEQYRNDLQNALSLSVSDFSYMQMNSNISSYEQNIPCQSHSSSPRILQYPMPSDTHEGQSIFVHETRKQFMPHSLISTTSNSCEMTSPATIKTALNEFLPVDIAFSSTCPTITRHSSPGLLSTSTDLYCSQAQEENDDFLSNHIEIDDVYKYEISANDYKNMAFDYTQLLDECGRVATDSNYGQNLITPAGERYQITFCSEERHKDFSCKNISFPDGDELSFGSEAKGTICYNKDVDVINNTSRPIIKNVQLHPKNQADSEPNNNHEDGMTINSVFPIISIPTYKDIETAVLKSSSTSSITSSVVSYRKHHSNSNFVKFRHQSRLRLHRFPSHILQYTPGPMLNPLRNSTGLYWQAVGLYTTSKYCKEEMGANTPVIEGYEDPHVNIGPEFQAIVQPVYENVHISTIPSREELIWEPVTKYGLMDNELDMYLEFARTTALPKGDQSKEYALYVLHQCHGNIHEAVLKLMQSPLHVNTVDVLLKTFNYSEYDNWNAIEIESFQQSIMKFNKNFMLIAQHIRTKTTKHCIQFYYSWKKINAEEYKRCKMNWKKIKELEVAKTKVVVNNKVNVAGEVNLISTLSDVRPYTCEFPECLARFNSKAALNGHNRIHGRSIDKVKASIPRIINNIINSNNSDEFPCKLCGKIFNKIKSRSAHMKSHRHNETENKK